MASNASALFSIPGSRSSRSEVALKGQLHAWITRISMPVESSTLGAAVGTGEWVLGDRRRRAFIAQVAG